MLTNTIFVFLCSIFLLQSCTSNTSTTNDKQSKDHPCEYEFNQLVGQKIYTKPDVPASFSDGTAALLKYISSHYVVPADGGFQGTFIMELIIDENGDVLNIAINKHQKQDYTASETAMAKVIKETGKWNPAKCNGATVCALFTFPIRL